MVPFSYLRRATSTAILRRLLSLDEHALPRTIKFIAAKALNGDTTCKTHNRQLARSSSQQLSSLLQEKIRQTTADEWETSAIITVVYYLACAGNDLSDVTKSILIKKIAKTHDLNLIDLWQLLAAAKRLSIKLPLQRLKRHLEGNVEQLLVNGSCKNVSSALYGFSACGITIKPEVLQYIAEYYRKEMAHRSPFKDVANFINCFATHVNMIYKGAEGRVDNLPDGHASVTGGLLGTLGSLIQECKEGVKENSDDLEGLADVLDAVMVYQCCRLPDGHDCRQQYIEIEHLLKTICRGIKRSAEFPLHKVDLLGSEKRSASRNVEPRILRIILRNLVLAGMQQPELFAQIMGYYRFQPFKWSAQGNADVLRSVVFFGYQGPEVGDLVQHISSMYHGDFYKHIDTGKILIDACLLAVTSCSQPYYTGCLRLVSSALKAVDTITTDCIALAMLILELNRSSYEAVPLFAMRRIAKRLEGSIITLQVHTRENALSMLSRPVVYDTGYHSHFTGLCKVELK